MFERGRTEFGAAGEKTGGQAREKAPYFGLLIRGINDLHL